MMPVIRWNMIGLWLRLLPSVLWDLFWTEYSKFFKNWLNTDKAQKSLNTASSSSNGIRVSGRISLNSEDDLEEDSLAFFGS